MAMSAEETPMMIMLLLPVRRVRFLVAVNVRLLPICVLVVGGKRVFFELVLGFLEGLVFFFLVMLVIYVCIVHKMDDGGCCIIVSNFRAVASKTRERHSSIEATNKSFFRCVYGVRQKRFEKIILDIRLRCHTYIPSRAIAFIGTLYEVQLWISII